MSLGAGKHQFDVGKCADNSFKGTPVNEVLGRMAKLRVHYLIKINNHDPDGEHLTNWSTKETHSAGNVDTLLSLSD